MVKLATYQVILRDGLPPVEANLLKNYSRRLSDPETGKDLIMFHCKEFDLAYPHLAKLKIVLPDEEDIEHVVWIPHQFILMISDISDERRPIGFTILS
jgi:hypothetical protein